nr:hypothetical protein [Oscillospiraceae bacterium]
MNKKALYALWGGMFLLCAGLGFLPEPAGAVRILLTALSLAFFLPPALLLHRAAAEGDRRTLQLVRNLCAASLGLTVLLLIVNFMTALSSEALGTVVHYILTMVSAPMICSGHWAMSLFLWACLLMASLTLLKKK